MIADRYYYSRLTKREQTIYKDLYQGVKNMEPRISTIYFSEAQTIANKVFEAFVRDNPHFFYFDFTRCNLLQSSKETVFEANYIYGKSDADKYSKRCMQKVDEIVKHVYASAGNDEVKREKELYTYFCEHFHGLQFDDGRKLSEPVFRGHSIIGPLIDGRANCDGFARAFKLVLNAMDMKCIFVSGTADSPDNGPNLPHGWNIVKINGKNYHTDVTWGVANSSPGNVVYNFLNLTDSRISVDHHWKGTLPKCTSDDLGHFKASGLQIDNTIFLKNHIKKAIQAKKTITEFELVKGQGKCGFNDLSNAMQLVQAAAQRASGEVGERISYEIKYMPGSTAFRMEIKYD